MRMCKDIKKCSCGTQTCTQTLIATLFIITKGQEHTKCPSTGKEVTCGI